ncbi:hypothetical protein ABIA35_005804 [Catenulispora sp. MAP12-49]
MVGDAQIGVALWNVDDSSDSKPGYASTSSSARL